jgi:xanthine/uracil permease
VAKSTHPVDQQPPLAELIPLGLQHVLVMYAGAVAVPLIIGRALRLPSEQIAILVNADLFICGVVTIIQSVGIGPFGIRLPIMMGVTFASVEPMLLGALVTAVPLVVLGGAGIVMFGMVAATGIRILASVEYKANRNNLFIVAISLGFGMIPLVAPTFFATSPKSLEPLLNSGIVLAAVAAVLLNVYFNGAKIAGAAEVPLGRGKESSNR